MLKNYLKPTMLAATATLTTMMFTATTINVNADNSVKGEWRTKNGSSYWYENGIRQGVRYNEDGSPDTSYRGKEIYDPASDAWYWLDCVQNGAKAVNKDVYQESLADDNGNIGKWVRYDGDGHMVKGWQTNENGTYYFDPVYGTMYKGDKVIDGVAYHFNEDTGILDSGALSDDNGKALTENGWHVINGTEYWYENGVRQGYDAANPDYRGKEIYDPGSDAWYWLDNVQQGAKAVSKDVYQESEAGRFGDVAGEDGKTYGKWVRYDGNGHMVKGWQTTDAGTYYFDTVYGAMAKGSVVIDNVEYTFASDTGVQTAPVQSHVHSYTSTVTKTATCTEEGITTFTCSCGDGYTEPIAKVAHSFGEYIYNNDATTENDGTKTATCSVCGTTDTIVAEGTKVEGTTYPALPTEHCPYPVNTIIDNGDGTYCMYYVNSGRTMDKFGISDGFVGNNAGNDFQSFCDKNYLDVMFDTYIGDYSKGCINWICAEPRSF